MTIPSPSAFSPGSVTCFFVPSIGTDRGGDTSREDARSDSSSAGCGINLSDGVTAAVQSGVSRSSICINGVETDFAPVHRIVEALAAEPVTVYLETPLPVGCGFGVSAAACLTTAFALARRFDLEQSREQLAQLALRAEIQERTGIGDVPTQITGGVVYRRWKEGPFDCKKLDLPGKPLFYRAFGTLSTRAVLSDPARVRDIAEQGRQALDWLEKAGDGLTIEQLLERSLAFARGAGQVQDARVQQAIAEVIQSGGKATMVMLGQSVLADRPGDGNNASLWTACQIDDEGTRWL